MDNLAKHSLKNHAKLPLLLFIASLTALGMLTAALGSAEATPAATRPSGGCTPVWQQVTSQDPGPAANNLSGVAAISLNDVWMVGYQRSTIYSTLIEHWNGTALTVVSSPNPAGQNYLVSAHGVNANDVWAVGTNVNGSVTQTLVEHWDGSAWSVVSSPNPTTTSYLMGVSAVSANDAWAVGYSIGPTGIASTLVEHWNGSAWSVVASPNPGADSNSLNAVTATSGSDAWAVGITSPDGVINQTLTMHWNGAAWTTVTSPNQPSNDNYLQSVSASGPSDVWAVGYYSSGNFNSSNLALHWNGSAWSQGAIGNPTGYSQLSGVVVRAPDDVWAVGFQLDLVVYYTTTQIQHFDGVSWSPWASPNPNPTNSRLAGVAAVDSSNAWAVGTYGGSSGGATLAEQFTSSCPPPTATPAPPTATPTACAGFTDVPPDSPFYPYISCLSDRGVISGYSDCTLRPGSNITRGQVSKIVSNSAGFNDDVTGRQTYTDMPSSHPFWLWIERLSLHETMGGYTCGGAGEPCDSQQRPYFRPAADVTRGQLSKITSNAAGFSDTPTGQTFEDVPSTNAFWLWIERLSAHGAIGGYTCGGVGEPCGSGNRPYFRPGNNVTRGQASKIIANAFFPNCQSR